jgi:hypothetical protein
MAGSPDSDRCIGYITKYLVKDIAERREQGTPAQAGHADRLLEALRHEPCSPACANWLRYGIQPKGGKAGLTPGYCKNKAHRREYLGYAGRRVLVSRKWSGKTMADHKNDRKNWVLARLAEAGVSATGHPTEPSRYAWELAPPDHPTSARSNNDYSPTSPNAWRCDANSTTPPRLRQLGRRREARRVDDRRSDARRIGRCLSANLLPVAGNRACSGWSQAPDGEIRV